MTALSRDQVAAWKAGHKHKCDARQSQGGAAEKLQRAARVVAAEADAARSYIRLTASQGGLVKKLFELEDRGDWLGVVALKSETMSVAQALRATEPGLAERMHNILGEGFESTGDYASACEVYEQHKSICAGEGDLEGVTVACTNLGRCYHHTGDYALALEMHEKCMKTCEQLGDSKLVARACCNLGNTYFCLGKHGRALELHEKCRATCEALGDKMGVATACGNLGLSYYHMGNYGQARQLHEQHMAQAEAAGDLAGVARACCNIGNCYLNTGEYERARKLLQQGRAMVEKLGDRDQVAATCDNLGLTYQRTGQYALARKLHELSKAISEEIGNRPVIASACQNIAKCCLNTGYHEQAILYFRQNYEMAKEMQVEAEQGEAALGIGIALTLEVRAKAQDPKCTTMCDDDAVKQAEKWLQTALQFGYTPACLYLARLALDVGTEDAALQYLHDYLSRCVEQGRNHCNGCCQTRGDDAQMLTCGCCRVARFCSVEHQKMASKSVAEGGSLFQGRHKDVCGLLCKWRQQVVKGGKPPAVLRTDLLAFLRM